MGTDRQIVVGFDGSPGSAAALRWALADGRAVAAVEICPPDTEFLPATSMALLPHGAIPRQGTGPLTRIAQQIADEGRATHVEVRQVSGRTGRALAEFARDADLIVIGAHHHASYLASGMGAFAMDCVRHARCPVAVIPEGAGQANWPGR